jgi:hypothetical protein
MIASKLELALVIFLLFLPERAGKMTLRGLNNLVGSGRMATPSQQNDSYRPGKTLFDWC